MHRWVTLLVLLSFNWREDVSTPQRRSVSNQKLLSEAAPETQEIKGNVNTMIWLLKEVL